ncbi:unnamed protein product [Choristocarpus tenellus]
MISCTNTDFFDVGMQEGEEILLVIHLLALLLTWSLASSWLQSASRLRRKIILFLHWLSGLFFTSCQAVTMVMILNCWSTDTAKPIVYGLKFISMTSANLFALSDLALTIRLAQIVEGLYKLQRVKVEDSKKLAGAAVFVALIMSCSSAFCWREIGMSGGNYFVFNREHEDWIRRSHTIVPTITGFIMAPVLFWILLYRWKELRKCCETKIFKQYFMLTMVGATVYFYNFATNLEQYDEVNHYKTRVITVKRALRYVHICLDSLVLLSSVESVLAPHKIPSFSRHTTQSSQRQVAPMAIMFA